MRRTSSKSLADLRQSIENEGDRLRNLPLVQFRARLAEEFARGRMTERQVADLCEVGECNVENWLVGIEYPPLPALLTLGRLTGFDLAYLMTGCRSTEPPHSSATDKRTSEDRRQAIYDHYLSGGDLKATAQHFGLPMMKAYDIVKAMQAAMQEKAIENIRNFLDQQPAPLPILVADGPIGDFLRAMGELPRRDPDFLEIDDTRARELALRHICCMPLTAIAWLQLAVMARLLMHPNPAPEQ